MNGLRGRIDSRTIRVTGRCRRLVTTLPAGGRGVQIVVSMPQRVVTLIDGESHFHRAEEAWQKVHGDHVRLENLRYIENPDDQLVLVNPKARVFWTRRMNPGLPTYYYTSISGDVDAVFDLQRTLRQFDVEPEVVVEVKQLYDKRANLLKREGLIEKAKGIDAAIFVTMMEGAYEERYDLINLYTSDIDFIPVIRSVKKRGVKVIVHGFKEALGKNSPMLTVPNNFIDLTDIFRNECSPAKECGNG